MPVYEYLCLSNHRTRHLHRRREMIDGVWHENGEDPPASVACEVCATPARYIPSAPAVRMALGKHFDIATGREFANEAERNAYCRERGLTTDPASHHAEYLARREQEFQAAIAREDAEFAKYEDEVAHAPEHAAFRQQLASGYFHEKAVERVQAANPDVVVSKSDIAIASALPS